MNPLIFSTIFRILGNKRICPTCKKGQLVSSNQKRKPVKCKFFGATIPAQSAD